MQSSVRPLVSCAPVLGLLYMDGDQQVFSPVRYATGVEHSPRRQARLLRKAEGFEADSDDGV